MGPNLAPGRWAGLNRQRAGAVHPGRGRPGKARGQKSAQDICEGHVHTPNQNKASQKVNLKEGGVGAEVTLDGSQKPAQVLPHPLLLSSAPPPASYFACAPTRTSPHQIFLTSQPLHWLRLPPAPPFPTCPHWLSSTVQAASSMKSGEAVGASPGSTNTP